MNNKAFLIIPYSLLNINTLKLTEKIVLCEIISLSKQSGYCYGTNKFISRRTGVSPSKVSQAISKLKRNGFIFAKTVNSQRRLFVSRDKITSETMSVFNLTNSDTPFVDSNNPLSRYNNPLANFTTNKKNSKKINNKSNMRTYRRDASYDIEELMKIK